MNDMQEQVVQYNQLVESYQLLDKQIDALLTKYEGHTENMPDTAMQHYRKLASERDDAFNAMRTLEQQLFSDDNQ